MIRFSRDPARIVSSFTQSILFLFVLGTGLSAAMRGVAGTYIDYRAFMLPGILGMTIIFTAVFSAVSIVWDREFGFLKEVLVAPVPRLSVALGKILGGSTIALLQGMVMLSLAPIVGITLSIDQVIFATLVMLLLGATMSSMGTLVAARMRSMEGFQMVMQLLMMPILFLSGAFFPLGGIPLWLRILTQLDPATYGIDPLRQIVLRTSLPQEALRSLTLYPLAIDLAILSAMWVVFISLSLWAFNRRD
jgi:ABC-2 type transport system permease protein